MKLTLSALTSAAAAASLAFVATTAATAAPPEVPADLYFDAPAGLACEFPLLVEGTGSKVQVHEFKDRDGNLVRVIQAGKGYTLTYTNQDTGESITFESNGTVNTTTIDPVTGIQTVQIVGHTGLVLFPSDIPAGPSTTQYVGRVVYTVDAFGVFEVQSESGTAVDVCEALS